LCSVVWGEAAIGQEFLSPALKAGQQLARKYIPQLRLSRLSVFEEGMSQYPDGKL
jgi:hypothetical protein